MLYGVGALFAGVLLFAIAPSVGLGVRRRALMGAGVGLALTPATAAVVELQRARQGGARLVHHDRPRPRPVSRWRRSSAAG
jgi:hypothetical protein